MKKVVISCGPIPARLDSVKFISNRFKGGLAFKTAAHLIKSELYEVTIVKWKHTPLPEGVHPAHVVDVEDVFDYYKWFETNATRYNAFIMAAAVANLTPSNPYEGKFPSHNYAVGESFPIQFEIAPRAIDVVKKKNPRACLIGYKLFDAATDEELVDIARHTLADAKANIIFANTPSTAKDRKIAVMADNTALPCTFKEHLNLITGAIDAAYFRTEIVPLTPAEAANPAIRNALATVQMFEKTFPGGFGTVAVPVDGSALNIFATTSRGHKGEPVIVRNVDFEEGVVYATGKATLNAPTLAGVLAQAPAGTIIVHRHDDDPLFSQKRPDFTFPRYLFPGTFEEAYEVTKAFAKGYRRIRLMGHGDIGIRPVRPVDWKQYYEIFPDRYFGVPAEMQKIIDKYAGWETLEVGCNRTACTKYAFDPYVQAENAINLTWHEVREKKFALVVAKNSVNYLTLDQLKDVLNVTDRFVANTFLVPPESKVTDREAAILVGPSIWHTLRLDDDSIACHDFFARTQADYEAMGLKVAPYGKNSALLTKGI